MNTGFSSSLYPSSALVVEAACYDIGQTLLFQTVEYITTEEAAVHVTKEPSPCYMMQGAVVLLKLHPDIWMKLLKKAQTPQLLSRDYAGTADRQRMSKNDSIFGRLDNDFGFEAAL